MHIYWAGETAVRIETKNADEAVVLLIDPYRPLQTDAPRSIKADVILYSRGRENSITLTGEPFVMDTPGEIETKGVLIYGISGANGVLWFFEAEGITLAHIGSAGRELDDKQLELLSNADILFVPVGGGGEVTTSRGGGTGDIGGKGVKYFPNAEEAAKIVTQVEPRIIIPIAFGTLKGEKLAPAHAFIKEVGVENGGAEPKLKISKKDLPQDEMRVVVLERSWG